MPSINFFITSSLTDLIFEKEGNQGKREHASIQAKGARIAKMKAYGRTGRIYHLRKFTFGMHQL